LQVTVISDMTCYWLQWCNIICCWSWWWVIWLVAGPEQNCVDSLAYDTLVPKSIVQRYVSLLMEHRRIILCGSSGTGKTYMARRLAEHLILRLVNNFYNTNNNNTMARHLAEHVILRLVNNFYTYSTIERCCSGSTNVGELLELNQPDSVWWWGWRKQDVTILWPWIVWLNSPISLLELCGPFVHIIRLFACMLLIVACVIYVVSSVV